MAYYRLYFLSGFGRIEQFREFDAAGDTAAIAQVDAWRGPGAMELWSGRRKVRSWTALGQTPEARARSAVRALRLAS
jgi:hypothetical protein